MSTQTRVWGETDSNILDRVASPVLAKFNRVDGGSTTTSETAIDDLTLDVADGTQFNAGSYVVLYNTDTDRFYVGYALSVTTNTLTLDTPIDAIYPIGSVVGSSTTNMAVDGSTTTQTFGLRGASVTDPLNLTFDISRIIFHCTTTDAVDLSTFGDIESGLTNGLVLRKRGEEYMNLFNVKTNGDIDGITFDWAAYESSNPNQGQDGFTARLTFNGQDKLGTIIRLPEGTDLEFLVQDDLSSITSLEVMAQGHVASDEEI